MSGGLPAGGRAAVCRARVFSAEEELGRRAEGLLLQEEEDDHRGEGDRWCPSAPG